MTEQLIELLYVDRERLESYYQQLNSKPRRVPSFSASLGLTGPQVGATWSAEDSSTLIHKVEAVRRHLAESGILSYTRPVESDRWDLARPREDLPDAAQADLWGIFREELVELRTTVIEPRASSPFLRNGLTLWVATEDGAGHAQPDVLVLIQQFPLDDQPFARTVSGYSLLSMEADELRLPTIPGIGANPLAALSQIGARIGPAKMCKVLYRVRATFAETERHFSLTTVGYPLVISRG